MLDTIKLGSVNNLVKVAKYLMNYSAIKKASEIFDASFEEAVKQWQKNNNLTVDGIIGENSWTVLAQSAPTCSTNKNKTSVYTCAVQILVGGLTIDGIYGSNTKKGVVAFQSASGLSADGICGLKTWNALIVGKVVTTSTPTTSAGQTVTGNKVLNNCVKYLQWDSRWKNVKYSTHTSAQTIGNSGCGPSSMAMILATWENSKITPVECCDEAYKNGYRTYDSGTAWGYFKYVFSHHDCFEKYVETTNVTALVNALYEGALAVCSMNANDNCFWTTGGHFIVARGCDDTYIYANDPNKSETPRKQAQTKFAKCLKKAFIFYPKKKVIEPEPEKKQEIVEPSTELKLDSAIIDISKWQGTINFDKLAKKVSLVIARAGVGSDADSQFDNYATEMNKRGIPFGVYCYSYAGDEAKAKDEAQKIISRASKYNPLFYVMDAEESKITNAAIKAFAAELRAKGAKKIGCYVANNRYTTYKYSTLQDKFDFTWIPRYGSNNGTIAGSTKPAYFCDLWQYTSTGKIDGISGNVDMNIITGDGHDLKWFLNR